MFSFVRKCQTAFWSGWTILHFHQQWMRVPIAPHPSSIQGCDCAGFWPFRLMCSGILLFAINFLFITCVSSVWQRRQWHLTPVLLPGKSHRWRSLVGCSLWGLYESDMTEQLHFHSSLSCIGEGNGNPLQCSCLENSRDRGAWWAAVYGVAQSQTRLKRLGSGRVGK